MHKFHTVVIISLQENNCIFQVQGTLNWKNTCWQMVLRTYLAYSLKLAVSMEMLFPQAFEFCEAVQISSGFPSRRDPLIVKSSFFRELTLLLPILASPEQQNTKAKSTTLKIHQAQEEHRKHAFRDAEYVNSASTLRPGVQSYRKWIKRIHERTQRIRHPTWEKKAGLRPSPYSVYRIKYA